MTYPAPREPGYPGLHRCCPGLFRHALDCLHDLDCLITAWTALGALDCLATTWSASRALDCLATTWTTSTPCLDATYPAPREPGYPGLHSCCPGLPCAPWTASPRPGLPHHPPSTSQRTSCASRHWCQIQLHQRLSSNKTSSSSYKRSSSYKPKNVLQTLVSELAPQDTPPTRAEADLLTVSLGKTLASKGSSTTNAQHQGRRPTASDPTK